MRCSKTGRRTAAVVVALLCAGLANPAWTEAEKPASARQQQVEQQLAQLRHDIQQLQEELSAARSDHQAAQQRLREVDLEIQQSTQAIRALESQLAEHQGTLEELEAEREQQMQQMQLDQQQLAEQVSATYRLSRQSRLKLVLNQDNPAKLNRLLAYYEHINQAQSEKILALRETLATLASIHERIEQQLRAITTAQELQQAELEQKQQQRESRQQILTSLRNQIGSNEAQLNEFEQNRRDLEAVLEKLNDVLSDIPADLGRHHSVSAQKRQLPLPVKARVSKAFGQQRSGGMYWQGWIMDAEPGTEVQAIAYGRVAFADWLRGYGLMIIIDHGEGFMSLYGYNESLLWEVGDWVEPGAVIATVGGNSAGERGLYFELRKDGKALDPAGWLKR